MAAKVGKNVSPRSQERRNLYEMMSVKNEQQLAEHRRRIEKLREKGMTDPELDELERIIDEVFEEKVGPVIKRLEALKKAQKSKR